MAGSWGSVEYRNIGETFGKANNMFALARSFTADAAAHTVPDWDISEVAPAFLSDIGVVFDGTAPPDAVIVTVKDIDGLTAFTSATLTASGRESCEDRPSVIGGCTVAISGNTTNSAVAKVILNFASNRA